MVNQPQDGRSPENGLKAPSSIEKAELVVSNVLMIGVLLSATVILAGFLLFLITGTGGYPGGTFPTDPLVVFQGVARLKPYAIIQTGLMILILTPVLRVGVSVLVFLKEKDALYVKITAAVFVILIISFLLGKVE